MSMDSFVLDKSSCLGAANQKLTCKAATEKKFNPQGIDFIFLE